MSKCIYCGQKSGFLKNKHRECETKHLHGIDQIIEISRDSITLGSDFKEINDLFTIITKDNYISESKKNEAILEGWDRAIDQFIDKGIITKEEENRIANFNENFIFSIEALNRKGSYKKIIQSIILREIIHKNILSHTNSKKDVPLKVTSSETLIYVFSDVKYFEQESTKFSEDGYKDFFMNIAQGTYLRPKAFEKNPIKTADLVHIDDGILGITNRHIYFSGAREDFHVRFNKINKFDPYTDGFGILKFDTTAKPQIFKTNEGWFSYNLVINAARQ